ncbi:YggT family protein [Homoserinimonas aerilata]|uniref:YggT family protein n=1 Tax=Homoserinimonas aerilata TaxID=1162970 RepID=A0A542YJJ7_9MICO|nr:YggT family protein [Homoserinimonas aerilata]TQL48144.1 YggT family protein [Homoserinimonas aerilata]
MILFVLLTIAYFALLIYFLLMWGRFILELVVAFSRGWRPKGAVLVLAEFVYTLTDPPVLFTRRLLPPIRLGGISLDFAWSIVMLVVLVLLYVVSAGRQMASAL